MKFTPVNNHFALACLKIELDDFLLFNRLWRTKENSPCSGQKVIGLKENWLPLLDEFRNWCMTGEAEEICKELTVIT
jgi:hypothetical protein